MAAFVLDPWLSGYVYKPFKSSLSIPHSLLGLPDVNPGGFQSQTFWDLISLVFLIF